MGEHKVTAALRGILLAALFVLVLSCAAVAYNPGDPEFRAIYVNAWGSGLKNSAEIDQLVATARYCNANAIVAQVRRRGDTIYPSIEPTASGFSSSFDSLAYLIQKCHNGTPRLEVHAWFVVWPIAGTPPTNENHPYKKYPQYLTKTDSGETFIADDYWFDPGHPGAEQYTCDIIMDVVNRYDVDGINFDYIRYGYGNAGYNDVSVARFNSFSSRYGGDFSLWRREQVTNFVRKVYANAIAVKPNIKVSADVIGGTPAPTDLTTFQSKSQAYTKYFQNFPAWMQEGILDMDITMAYFDCNGEYAHCYDPWVCFTRNYAYNRHAIVAPGVYSSGCLATQLDHTRTLPCGPTNGAAVYAYHALNSSMQSAIRSVWTTPAPVPTMPWKTSPTKGHMKGNVTFGGSTWIDGATISITGPTSRSMYADGTGFFAFIDLPAGNYTLTCTANGYGVITQSVQVNLGQVTTANCDYPISTLIISDIQVTNETTSGATITWTTNAGSSSKVYYGLDKTCSSSTTENSTQVTAHSVTLGGLQPNRTYYFKVYSLNPGAPAALSTVCALVTRPATPVDIIIESRSGGKNYAWYYDVNASGDSGAKSSAAGCTPAIGSRYMSLQASYNREAHYRPAITTAGSYAVYVTWGTSASGGSNIKHTVTYNGGSYTTSFNQATNSNVWNYIGTFPFAAGASGSCGEVKQWADALEAGKRFTADAVKFVWANTDTTPPTTPTNLSATTIQDDSITLGWTASTDNVGIGGYRISRGLTSSSVYVVDTCPTNSFVDTTVSPNTRYWFAVSAYDTSGNKSATTSTINMWSLCPKPTMATITCDKQAGVWHSSGPFTFTAVNGFGPGAVNYYRWAFDTSTTHTWTDAEAAWVVGTKACSATTSADPYYLHIRGYNQVVMPGEASDLGPFYVDGTPPSTPVVTDEKYTTSTSTLNASWSATDGESGVKRYEYAVGTSPLGTQIRGWTSAGTDTTAVISGLSLSMGSTYYVSVRAVNYADLTSSPGASAGVKVAQQVAGIREAKGVNTGTAVALPARVVSAAFPTAFYICEEDRLSGIRIQSASSLVADQLVTVMGTLGFSSDGERAILDPVFPDPTETGAAIAPWLITGKAANGATQGLIPGTTAGVGLNSTGLLVRIAGKVTAVVADGFYLDDGSRLTDDSANPGIKIWTGAPDSATINTNVTVTGIVSLRKVGTTTYPQILKRN